MADLTLQSAINAARAVQLPKERSERAVERGANPASRSEGEEAVVRRYDGMVPCGGSGKVALIVEALTENRNRTAANVRHLIAKVGGELLPTGANDWMFEHVGLIWVSNVMGRGEDGVGEGVDHPRKIAGDAEDLESTAVNVEALLECALEGGAIDVDFGPEGDETLREDDEMNDHVLVKCEPNNLLHLVRLLKADGYVTNQFETQWLVKDEGNKTLLDEEGAEKFEKFLDSMEEDLDVTHVFHNALFACK